MTHTRRAVLGGAATLLHAGCTSGPLAADDQFKTTTTTTTSTTTTTGAVTVQDITVQPEVVARSTADAINTSAGLTDQYILATVTAEAPMPDADDFQIVTDDQTYPPDSNVGGLGGQLWPQREPYGDNADGWLAFVVPNPLDSPSATLSWPGGTHPLSDTHLTGLNRSPTNFAIESFTAPEEIITGEDAILTFEITNTGDTDGTWVGALNRSGPGVVHIPEARLIVDISAGETVTHTYTNTPDDRYSHDGGDMEFRLTWRGGSQSRTVTVLG